MITARHSFAPVFTACSGGGESEISRGPDSVAVRILIVEDNPLSQKLLNDLLEANGYAPFATASGLAAVELARTTAPDLILMDVELPDLSGIEATRRLKADPCTRDIPILIVTASAMPGVRRKAFESGCDGFVEKPINIDPFLREIAARLAQRVARMQ